MQVVVDSISYVHDLKTALNHNISDTKEEPQLEKSDCSTTEQMIVQESQQPKGIYVFASLFCIHTHTSLFYLLKDKNMHFSQCILP